MPEGPFGRILFARRSGPLAEAFWAVLAVAVPTLMKFLLDRTLDHVPPFLTFFPAITIAALCLGYRWGVAVLLACALLCDFFFMKPYSAWSVSSDDGVVLLIFIIGGGLIVWAAGTLRRAAHALRLAASREQELNAELKHRVNNNLAVVQALASQIGRKNEASRDFYLSLRDRLHALREAHEVLASTDWSSCDLPRIADRTLRAFENVNIDSASSPAAMLPPESCVPLTLALHELGINALQFGALSVPEGRVEIDWSIERGNLRLNWSERGGPPVSPPTDKGIGTRILKSQPGLDAVTIDYLPEGVRCSVTIKGARPT
jgi:two-component sensor histidine kinase